MEVCYYRNEAEGLNNAIITLGGRTVLVYDRDTSNIISFEDDASKFEKEGEGKDTVFKQIQLSKEEREVRRLSYGESGVSYVLQTRDGHIITACFKGFTIAEVSKWSNFASSRVLVWRTEVTSVPSFNHYFSVSELSDGQLLFLLRNKRDPADDDDEREAYAGQRAPRYASRIFILDGVTGKTVEPSQMVGNYDAVTLPLENGGFALYSADFNMLSVYSRIPSQDHDFKNSRVLKEKIDQSDEVLEKNEEEESEYHLMFAFCVEQKVSAMTFHIGKSKKFVAMGTTDHKVLLYEITGDGTVEGSWNRLWCVKLPKEVYEDGDDQEVNPWASEFINSLQFTFDDLFLVVLNGDSKLFVLSVETGAVLRTHIDTFFSNIIIEPNSYIIPISYSKNWNPFEAEDEKIAAFERRPNNIGLVYETDVVLKKLFKVIKTKLILNY